MEKFDFTVTFFSTAGSREEVNDRGFGRKIKWDIDLLSGYKYIDLEEARKPGRMTSAFSYLISVIRTKKYSSIICILNIWSYQFWGVLIASKMLGIKFIVGGDISTLNSENKSIVKPFIKKILLKYIYGFCDRVLVMSSRGQKLLIDLGVVRSKIVLAPSCVDNDYWVTESAKVDRNLVRQGLGIGEKDLVVLYSAKLLEKKCPEDLLEAFIKADILHSYLLFVGDGPLNEKLKKRAEASAMREKIKFLGFVNQSKLPEIYTSSDIMVLPSRHEPFGVVVNEAMLCGCPVAVSYNVGSGDDLVVENKTGFVFRCGDTEVLSSLLKKCASERKLLKNMGLKARERMKNWSPKERAEAFIRAVEN